MAANHHHLQILSDAIARMRQVTSDGGTWRQCAAEEVMSGQQRPGRDVDAGLRDLVANKQTSTHGYRNHWINYYPDLSQAVAKWCPGARRERGLHQRRAVQVVEVGTAYGGNANYLLSTLPGIELYAVSCCAHVFTKRKSVCHRLGRNAQVDPFIPNYDAADGLSVFYQKLSEGFRNESFSSAMANVMAHVMHAMHGCRCA